MNEERVYKTYNIPRKMDDKLKKRAKKEDRPVTTIVRQALKAYLK